MAFLILMPLQMYQCWGLQYLQSPWSNKHFINLLCIVRCN
jgi:hypothetical protein